MSEDRSLILLNQHDYNEGDTVGSMYRVQMSLAFIECVVAAAEGF